jgi:hypothetical protein
VVPGTGLDVLEKSQFYCSIQDLNRSSSATILVILLTMLPLTDLKEIQKSILIKLDGSLGLDCLVHERYS